MDFLIGILVIIGLYYLIKYMVRLFAPKIINYVARKAEDHFKRKMNDFSSQNSDNTVDRDKSYKKGKINLKSNPSKKVGEYIDFEEVE